MTADDTAIARMRARAQAAWDVLRQAASEMRRDGQPEDAAFTEAIADWLEESATGAERLHQAGIDRQFDDAWVAAETTRRHGHALAVATTYLERQDRRARELAHLEDREELAQ